MLLDAGDDLADDLRRAGCTVLQVTDAAQAIAIAAGHRPDALVVSVAGKGNAGFLTAAMLRFDRVTAEVPLICLLDSMAGQEAAFATGCAAALSRPVTAAQILSTLRQLS